MNSITFQICSFFYILMLMFLYFTKKRIKTQENEIFSYILICNFIGLILDVFSIFTILYSDKIPIINFIVCKGYLIYLVTWITLFTVYIFAISRKSDESNYKSYLTKVKRNLFVICLVFICLIVILPLYYNTTPGYVYSYGPATYALYLYSGVCLILWIVILLKNYKNIKRIKCLPIFAYMVLGVCVIFIQFLNPNLLLMTSMESFIIFIMYHTIENPDIKMIEQLEVAREQADKANQAKTDFLSSMSHEIRTPLNAIVGFSDCIGEADSLDEAKENAKDIVNASKTLLEIVNGILDISKIEAGKLEIVNSSYHARELFEDLAKLIRPRMDEKALDFSYYIAPDLPDVLYGDHANLKKIVTNLLSNASKYTDKGFVKYEVNCVKNNNTCKLIISVEDSGRGIKKDSVDKLFTKFQRLEEDRNTTIEGTGLGLAITKQLIELMGGKIIVHTVYGEGSKFTVVLNQRIEKVEQVVEPLKVKTTLDLHDKRILLVDDNLLNIKVATKLLERYNANSIASVDSGFLCLDRIKAGEEYDVILLDDMMPKMSGVETLKKLKEIEGFAIPVVALTANAITGMKEKYLADGFDDYLAKPIEREQLIKVLNEIFDKNSVHKERVEDTEVITNINHDVIPVEGLSEEELSNTQKLTPIKEKDIEVLEDSTQYDEGYLRKNGIDMDNALSLLGDMEMYNDTLKDYLSEVDHKFLELKGYKDSGDIKNYSILVHSMKSDAKYLGFMEFADVAYQHELKSKEGDIQFVNTNFECLESELNKVLEVAREYANNI